jgi:hypothetical protein
MRDAKYGDFAGAFFILVGLDFELGRGHPLCHRSDDIPAGSEFCGGGTSGCFDANFPFASLVKTSGLRSGIAEVEALRLARGLGGGIGVSFLGANLPFESRSRECGAFSRVEDPIEACLLAGVPFLGANLPCASLATDEIVEFKDIDALRLFCLMELDACDVVEDESFLENLPFESRCTEIFVFLDVDANVKLMEPVLFLGVIRSRSRVPTGDAV